MMMMMMMMVLLLLLMMMMVMMTTTTTTYQPFLAVMMMMMMTVMGRVPIHAQASDVCRRPWDSRKASRRCWPSARRGDGGHSILCEQTMRP
jgi:fatty-acid desaturase